MGKRQVMCELKRIYKIVIHEIIFLENIIGLRCTLIIALVTLVTAYTYRKYMRVFIL